MTIAFPAPSQSFATLSIPLDEPLAWELVGLVVAPREEAPALLEGLCVRSSEWTAWALVRELDRSGRLLESTAELRDAILAGGVARFLLDADAPFEAAPAACDPRLVWAGIDAALPVPLRSIGESGDPRLAVDRAALTAPAWALRDSAPLARGELATASELPWSALPLPDGWRRLWRRAALRHGLDESSLTTAILAATREAIGGGSRTVEAAPSLAHRTLARTVAVVVERESSEADFRRRLDADRWASMKELAYGASHEINNPLANIASRAQVLAESERDAERRTKLQAIERQAFRAFTMIQNLMLVADPPAPQIERVDWSAALDRFAAKWSGEAASKGLKLEWPAPRERVAWIDADPSQTELVFDELLRNALEASSPGGRVRVVGPEPAREDFGAGPRDAWLLEIVDEGLGMSPVARERLFDPFYSGREAGRGQGFGLSKARRIVELHGGLLRCREISPRGLAMQWLFPRASAPVVPAS